MRYAGEKVFKLQSLLRKLLVYVKYSKRKVQESQLNDF